MSEKIVGYQWRREVADIIYDQLVDIHESGNLRGDSDEEIVEACNMFLAGLHKRRPELVWPKYERGTLH